MKKFGLVLGGAALGALLLAFIGYTKMNAVTPGSVSQSSEYNSTTTLPFSKTIYDLTASSDARPGTLGSVIITKPGAEIFLIDATTTNQNLRAANLTSSTIALGYFPAEMAAGVYTFDTYFKYGLQVVFGSTDVPSSTITFR